MYSLYCTVILQQYSFGLEDITCCFVIFTIEIDLLFLVSNEKADDDEKEGDEDKEKSHNGSQRQGI